MAETRICTKCGVEKNINEFRMKKSKGKLRRYSQCKECESEYNKQYNEANKERREQYREENKEHIREIKKKYKDTHKEQIREYQKKYDEEHKEQRKQYIQNNIEKIRKAKKKYKQTHKDKVSEYDKQYMKLYNKEYRESHREEMTTYKREYKKQRKKDDPLFKLKEQLRFCISQSFSRKKYIKQLHTEEIIGIPINEFIEYLLNTYKDNYGYEWDGKDDVHIDHITPLAKAESEEEIMKLCYYTNLQLLKSKDNLEKKDKLDWKIKKD